jgi:hypothetical protein
MVGCAGIKVFCFFSSEKKNFLHFGAVLSVGEPGNLGKKFFSEEKNQKTFIPSHL